MHFRIKLPYRLKYTLIAILVCTVTMGVSIIAFRAEAAPPYNSTRENAAVFASEGMIYDLAEIGEIPPAFEDIRIWLEERRQSEGFFRTVWLPGERLLMLRLLHRFDSPTLKGSRENELDHIMLLLLPIIRGGTEDAGKLLTHYNVKYIIVYLAFEEFLPGSWQKFYTGPPHLVLQEPWGLAPGGEAGGYVKLLDRQRDLKLVVDEPEYRIYENLDFTIPHISAYNRIFLVAPPGLTRGLSLEGDTPAIPRPVENWNYFYGYSRLQEGYPYQYLSGAPFHFAIEDFPLEYLHGQTMATIPELLSKIPNLNPSQHLLVLGEFLPSEKTREEYLKLTDAVIFLGDVDGSEAAKKWTEEAEAILFVHEAESCLSFTPIEVPEETDPMEITDDNQAAFWEGKGALQLSNETGKRVNGANSLKITVGSGEFGRWYLEHNYTTPQDWSGKDFISLNWYGGNTGAALRLIALNSFEPLNYFCYYFTDDFSGWGRIKMPLSNFTIKGKPSWDNITFLQISMLDENISDTWYLDRVIADVNPPTPTAIVIGRVEETDPMEIADDNQAAFWQGIGPLQLSNEVGERLKGADSLRITVDSNGEFGRWHLEHDYTTPQDWSGKDFISLYWYGGNTGATLRLIALNSLEPLNYFTYYFADDFSGWRRIKVPLGHFTTVGEPNWDNITLLQISVMDENVSGTWYLDRVIADVNPPPGSASAATQFSYEHALLVPQDGELVKQFFAPRANYFRFMIRAAVDGEISLKINDELLNITDIYEEEDGINWYESPPIYLETGDHILSIDFKGNEATFDQILILSTKREDITFKDIFSSDQLEIDWVEKRPSEYSVQVNSDSPAFIVLGEAYHQEWEAYTDDGENLKHIPAFPLGWANGFYLPQGGEHQVDIVFGMQKTKDIAIKVWMAAWICLVLAIVGSWGLYYRRRSPMMNTLLINNCPADSGIGVHTLSLYSALRKLDSGIELFTLEAKLVNRIYRRISYHYWSAPFAWLLSVLTNLIFMLKIPKKYALYHITSPSLAIAARRIKPCILTIHDLMPFTAPRFSVDLLLRKSMQNLTKAQRLICVSNYTKEELIRLFNIDPGIVRVIYNGLDHDQFKPRDKVTSRRMLGLSEDKVLVLHVGSEEPRKNIPTLIKAFYKFQTEIPNAILIRVGMKTPVTQRLINSLGLVDKVVYFRDGKSMGYFYNAADLFVFPSSLEGFGLPPLEAMASGCPVIASNKTSVPEVVGDAGILLDAFDANGFAYWMHKVHTDEELKAKLIEAGFKRSKLFSWEKCASETLEVYKEVLQMKP